MPEALLTEIDSADNGGNAPAVPFARASIARNLVKARKALALTQKQLAEKAGIRPEVLNRAERGVVVPSVRTLRKIDLIVQAHQPSTRKRRKRATA